MLSQAYRIHFCSEVQRIKLIRNPTRHVKQIFGKDEVTGSNPVMRSLATGCTAANAICSWTRWPA